MRYESRSLGCLHQGTLTVPLKKSSVIKLSYKCGSDSPSFTFRLWFLQTNRCLHHLGPSVPNQPEINLIYSV